MKITRLEDIEKSKHEEKTDKILIGLWMVFLRSLRKMKIVLLGKLVKFL